jgi:hypothetical protein
MLAGMVYPRTVYTDFNSLLCKIQGAKRSRWFGGSEAVMPPSLPSQMLSWSEMAQEGAGIHVEEAD